MRVFRSGTSEAYIGSKYVLKRRRNEKYPNCDCLSREIHWLKKLEGFSMFPKLIDQFANGYILLTYSGERITKSSVPKNWKEQVDYILIAMRSVDCNHNDIKPDDILILDGEIKLVDFGWATRTGEPIPPHWPKCINDLVRKPGEPFDDERSFSRSMNIIISGKEYRTSKCLEES